MIAPLRRGTYRRLATSLTFSLLATGAWTLAAVWQVLALGGGLVQVSGVAAAAAAASVATFLLGGVLADRVRPRRLLAGSESVRTLSTAAVAVLSVTGNLTVAHLVVAALVQGTASGLFMPAYSALLVRVVEPDELLAANGVEGMLRPVLVQALGPALAGAVVAHGSPAAAIAMTALIAASSALAAARLPGVGSVDTGPRTSLLAGLRDGLSHVVRSRWLLTTLLYSSVATLLVMGPVEVLAPFAVREAGGGPGDHALVLAALGTGAAVGSLALMGASLPRRYLTTMMVCWGLACLPLVVFGLGGPVWGMVAAGFVIGALFNAPMVIWGTVLQRRVPRELLGRVSGLDFFVSLGLLPLSIALAGPVGSVLGLRATFLVAALVPAALVVVAVVAGRLMTDETAHPLDDPPTGTDGARAARSG